MRYNRGVWNGGIMETTFSELPTNTAFTVTDTWMRDELKVGETYVKIDDRQALPFTVVSIV